MQDPLSHPLTYGGLTWAERDQAVQPVDVVGSIGDRRYEVAVRNPPTHPVVICQQGSIQLPARDALCFWRFPYPPYSFWMPCELMAVYHMTMQRGARYAVSREVHDDAEQETPGMQDDLTWRLRSL